MLRYVILLLTACVTGTLSGTEQFGVAPALDGRIVGGRDASIEQYPHQISMRYNGGHRCGGSIISDTIILSAAHCVVGLKDAKGLTIVAGNTRLSDKSLPLEVVKFIIHSSYRKLNNDYDVAILVLRGRLTFGSGVQPIEMSKDRPKVGDKITVTGWGTLVEGGSIPDHLQEVDIFCVSNDECKKAYPLMITSRMMCAAVPGGGKDACQGDSGGPLIQNNKQVGIVSWGSGCARSEYPGVYASVPDLYDWIVKTARDNAIGWA